MKLIIRKTTITSILFGIGLFFFQGCYTVVFDPERSYSDKAQLNDSTESGFYEDSYYGRYSSYYERSYWLDPSLIIVTKNGDGSTSTTQNTDKSRSSETEKLRNNDGGRKDNGETRASDLTSATKNETKSTTSTTTNTSSNSSEKATVKNDSGTSSSSSSTSRGSESSTTKSSSTGRNDDGGRSTKKGR